MPETLYDAVVAHARQRGGSTALADDAGRVDYRTLSLLADRTAALLRARGLGAGDVIALQLPNGRPFVAALLAAGAIGATVQMLHMPYRRAELATLLRHGRARAFVGLRRFKDETPCRTVAELGIVEQVIEADELPLAEPPASGDAPAAAAIAAPLDPDSRYVLLYTSGTTAEPKGVPVSHRRFVGNAAASLAPLGVTAADVLLPAAPFSHLYGLFVLEMALLAGACVALLPAYSPDALIATLRRDRVTAVFAGPAHFRPLLGAGGAGGAGRVDGAGGAGTAAPMPPADAFAAIRLVCLSGTAVAPDLARAVEALLPAGRVIQLWGMSELQAGSYGRPDDPAEIRWLTAGRPSPGTAFRIRPPDVSAATAPGGSAADLPPGREGRIQVRGPSLFDGYLDNPAATAAAFDDGWFDTGDLGWLTDDGALVLSGRVKEIINRGGVKFNPIDIEAIIDRIPGITRSAVVPMPDPVLGERACVFVETTAPITLAQVVAALEQAGIARFKWPERLETIAQMPLTPTQKVMRGRLTALLATGQAASGPPVSG
ncbi:MAG: class I adenylate-forming enzyme family protein [Lautropia sp.]